MLFVQPKLNRDQAFEQLCKPPGPLRKNRNPKSLEIVCLPYFVLEVQVSLATGITTTEISVDGLVGTFAFFDRSKLNISQEGEGLLPRFELSEDQARKVALEEYRRHLLHRGLKQRKRASVDKVIRVEKMYYPYWVGYFEKQGRYNFDAIDAVSGARQGAKMRAAFIKAFAQ